MFIVFDLDGTLADDSHRQHHITGDVRDWDAYFAACGDDALIEPVMELLLTLSRHHDVQIWTGRPERCRMATVKWLRQFTSRVPMILMRDFHDFRPDTEVKGEWLAECGDHPPDLLFDDRTKSVAFWRSQGITCLQVAQHDY